MTNQEAIDVLEHNFPSSCFTDLCEAVKMAVEALQRETSGDAIDRQAAIRWVKTECNPYGKPTLDFESGKRVMEHLKAMPSVQPEYEPVKTEDFAKTMSENTLYSFMAWHGEALELMERNGFVICKKTL